jgi:simple sugar transport system ATP-binding protein
LALVNQMSITRNFFLGRELTRRLGPIGWLDVQAMNKRAREALHDIGIHIRSPQEKVGKLSGGERQSIAIGRAKYFGAKLLILDEPTSALSVGETRKVLSYTRAAKKRGLGVIFITHNVSHVYQVADRFTIIRRGDLVGTYTRDEVTEQDIADLITGDREK